MERDERSHSRAKGERQVLEESTLAKHKRSTPRVIWMLMRKLPLSPLLQELLRCFSRSFKKNDFFPQMDGQWTVTAFGRNALANFTRNNRMTN